MLLNVLLEKTFESPLDCKEIQPVDPKGNQSWIFIGRTDAEAPLLWPPDVKNWLIGKDPDSGQDRRQEEKGMTENEMVGWHPWLGGHEFEQALGVGDGQAWSASVHEVSKSRTWLSDSTVVDCFLKIWFIYLAVLGFCCCMGFSLVVVHSLLIVVSFLIVEHKL